MAEQFDVTLDRSQNSGPNRRSREIDLFKTEKENLNLANNSLGAAPGHKVWHGLKKLESLHLTGNHIPIITTENFKNLKSLKRLFLDDNRIGNFSLSFSGFNFRF